MSPPIARILRKDQCSIMIHECKRKGKIVQKLSSSFFTKEGKKKKKNRNQELFNIDAIT